MKPVENTDWQSDMTENSPHFWSIELNLGCLVVMAPDQQGLHDVDSQVSNYHEGDCISSSH